MREIIQVAERHIGGGTIQTVNARDLHVFLEVGKDFSTWIKDRIQQYGFVEGVDYSTYKHPPELGRGGGRNKIDYHVSLDMAKLLCANEGNERGRAALKFMSANSICSIEELYSMLADIDVLQDDLLLYAIQEVETGRIKIGISSNPEQRLKQLQVGNPCTLVIIDQRPAPNRFKDEKLAHENNSYCSIRGEWFGDNATLGG